MYHLYNLHLIVQFVNKPWRKLWVFQVFQVCENLNGISNHQHICIHNVLVIVYICFLLCVAPSQQRRGSRARRRPPPQQTRQSYVPDFVLLAVQPSALGLCKRGNQQHCCKIVLAQEDSWLQGTAELMNEINLFVHIYTVLHGALAATFPVTKPKSPTFKLSSLQEKKMLEGFRSRWMNPFP